MMTQLEREDVARVINYFWGRGTVTARAITPRLAGLAYDILLEANKCSSAMHLVPRPAGGKPSLSYVIKQLSGIAKRIEAGRHASYLICKTRVSSLYKSVIYEALLE